MDRVARMLNKGQIYDPGRIWHLWADVVGKDYEIIKEKECCIIYYCKKEGLFLGVRKQLVYM